MTPELRLALDNVYAVFARYPMPDYLGLNGNFQLRELTVEQWHQLGKNNDVGILLFSDNGEMLRYFLPRWLEWFIQDPATRVELVFWELPNLGRELIWANWRSWPADEVASLRELFEIWTRAELAKFNGAPPALWAGLRHKLGEEGEKLGLNGFAVWSELLCFLAELGDVAAYLELWLDTNLPQLARWLWTEDFQSFQGAVIWITSSRLEAKMETAFFADADGPNAELFSRSIELIRSQRAR